MKPEAIFSPGELYMPVTAHTIRPRVTDSVEREEYSFILSSAGGVGQSMYYSEEILGTAVFSAFINRLTGSNEVIMLLDRGTGDLSPLKVDMDPRLTSDSMLRTVQSLISAQHQTVDETDLENVPEETGKMTFTFLTGKGNGSEIPSVRKRDLGFTFLKANDRITLKFVYNPTSIAPEIVKRWAENIQRITEAFMLPDHLISEMDIISNEESTLYKLWNTTECQYEKDLCVHDKLIAQAKMNPGKTALVFDDKKMSYAELDQYSNAFANYLVGKSIKNGDRVAVCLDRGFGLMVSIFGILKAGAVYMPVSPKFPLSRISEITDDASPALIVVSDTTSVNIPEGQVKCDIDLFMSDGENHNYSAPGRLVSPRDVAYIIYTSGTTGKPKGVMIEHHSVLNRIGWMQKSYPLTSDDVLIQKTPVTFDVSVWELFWWSFVGASLVLLAPDGEKSPELILQTIKSNGVTVIHFVPSMFSTFMTYLENIPASHDLASLRTVFCSGEALTTTVVNDFYRYCSKTGCRAKVVNLYGPTEATVDVSFYNCLPEPVSHIPIGKPIDNTSLFVVNDSFRLQPLNMPGELLICGVNLAKGYFNNKTLTDEKFIEFDLFGVPTRAYRTGDIAYWSEDGNIYYIGRADSQIKLRGMRIELGEIEAKILLCPEVKYCVVLLVNPGTEQSYLAAFYQPVPGNTNFDTNRLKEFLVPHLPEYKIPSLFREIRQIPLSTNGKVDRKVLLSYLTEKAESTPVSASNSVEKRIFEVWKRILKKDNFNLTANFFEIGGNSLLLVQMAILLKKEFSKDVNPMTIMQNPTIKALAKHLADKK